MAQITYSEIGSSAFQRMVGHNPELLKAFEIIAEAIGTKLSLPDELCEQVRRVLAHGRGSQY